MNYEFYFDETFHDQKITIGNNGKMNILEEGALDSYIGLFWGCEREKKEEIIAKLNKFENKYRAVFNLNPDIELKSSIIKKKNYEYGLQSFNKNAFDFYNDLFLLLSDIRPIIQVDFISKMEFFLRRVFFDIRFYNQEVTDSFFYSLTKFFIFYNHADLIQALYSVKSRSTADNLKRKLIRTLDYILKSIKDIKRKEREYRAFLWLKQVLSYHRFNMEIKPSYDFRYFPNFDGLLLLLKELNIPPENVDLFIDEGEKAYLEAKQYPYGRVEQCDSTEVIQIRLADFLSGFIGRMTYALSNDWIMAEDKIKDISKIAENDLETQRIHSYLWFEISRDKFELYKLICQVLMKDQQNYWATLTASYFDEMNGFYSLFRYFENYENFEQYEEIEPALHSKYYNAFCCNDLEKGYRDSGWE